LLSAACPRSPGKFDEKSGLKGNRNGALSLLRDAVDHGLRSDVDLYIGKDPELKSLHGDPRFDALVADARQRAAAVSKSK
jgi:hypothetical protein